MPQSMINFEENIGIDMFLGLFFIFIIISLRSVIMVLECSVILEQYPIIMYYNLIHLLSGLFSIIIIVMICILTLWCICIIHHLIHN